MFLKFSVSYEKDTTKYSEAKQLIKPWPHRTKRGEIRYLKLGIVQMHWKEVDVFFRLKMTSS